MARHPGAGIALILACIAIVFTATQDRKLQALHAEVQTLRAQQAASVTDAPPTPEAPAEAPPPPPAAVEPPAQATPPPVPTPAPPPPEPAEPATSPEPAEDEGDPWAIAEPDPATSGLSPEGEAFVAAGRRDATTLVDALVLEGRVKARHREPIVDLLVEKARDDWEIQQAQREGTLSAAEAGIRREGARSRAMSGISAKVGAELAQEILTRVGR